MCYEGYIFSHIITPRIYFTTILTLQYTMF